MAMSERDKKIVTYLLPLLAAGGLYWFGYGADDSWWNTYNARGAEIIEKDKKLHEAMEQQKNLETLKTEVEEMKKELLIAELLLPKENDVEGLLAKIPELIEEAGIPRTAVTRIAPSAQNSHEQYKEWPIAIEISEMTFAQLIELLNKFDNFERMLDVTNLPITIKKAEDNTLALSFNINVYVFKETAPEPAAGTTPE